jgi:ketopantoate reductase
VAILNGAISRSGREHGVPTPVNDFITSSLTVSHNRAMARRG